MAISLRHRQVIIMLIDVGRNCIVVDWVPLEKCARGLKKVRIYIFLHIFESQTQHRLEIFFVLVANDSVSTSFYSARDNVLVAYRDADSQFSRNIWTSPRLLFSYFKRNGNGNKFYYIKVLEIFFLNFDIF